MSEFRLNLKEKRSPHRLERESRYEVQVNGAAVGELYHNMTGFCGGLMDVHARTIDIGERGISAWKAEAATINRDARALLSRNEEDERQLVNWWRTARGDVFNLTFHDASKGEWSTLFVPEDQLYAGTALMDSERLSPSFFTPCDAAPDPSYLATPAADDRIVKGILETSDDDWNTVIVGRMPPSAAESLASGGLPDLGRAETATARLSDWSDEGDRVLFVRGGTLLTMVTAHGTEIMPAEALPRRGMVSQRDPIFAAPITSTADRPDIVVTEQQSRMYSDALSASGYKFRTYVEPRYEDTPSALDM